VKKKGGEWDRAFDGNAALKFLEGVGESSEKKRKNLGEKWVNRIAALQDLGSGKGQKGGALSRARERRKRILRITTKRT